MTVLLWLGIFWTFYGIAGILGVQHVPSKYKNKVWTKQYIRLCGIGWLMIGIPWILLYTAISHYNITWTIASFLIVLLSIPSIIFNICVEKKYKAKLGEKSENRFQ